MARLKSAAASLALSLTLLLVPAPAWPSDSGASAGKHDLSEDGKDYCYFAYHVVQHAPKAGAYRDTASYRIVLSNIGDCDLHHIRVVDHLPRSAQLISAWPVPTELPNHQLVWEHVSLKQGQRTQFEVTVATESSSINHFLTNTGCAFTSMVGTQICDTDSTWIHD